MACLGWVFSKTVLPCIVPRLMSAGSRNCMRQVNQISSTVQPPLHIGMVKSKSIDEALDTVSSVDRYLPESEWDQIRKIIENKMRGGMWYVKTMTTLNSPETARSLYQYILDKNYEIPQVCLATYIRILGNGDSKDHHELLDLYDKHLKNAAEQWEDYPPFDTLTALSLIWGLSKTSRWTEGLKLYEKLNDSGVRLPYNIYCQFVCAAVKQKDCETMVNLMEKEHFRLDGRKVLSVGNEFRFIEDFGEDQLPLVVKFLENLQEDTTISKENAISIQRYFQKCVNESWSSKIVKTKPRASLWCPHCGMPFQEEKLTAKEMDELAAAFREEVIIGENIYWTTTPEELTAFDRFFRERGPFHYVVDVLNVCHQDALANIQEQEHMLSKFLFSMGKVAEGKNILLVGRVFMKQWFELGTIKKQKKAHVWLAQGRSKDDIYTIYAALKSGPDCFVITRDLYGDMKCNLVKESAKIKFQKWQRLNQYPWPRRYLQGRIPAGYFEWMRRQSMTNFQEHEYGWHMLVHTGPKSHDTRTSEWLCIKNKHPLAHNQFGTMNMNQDLHHKPT